MLVLLAALFVGLPLLILVALSIHFARFYFWGEATNGTVLCVSSQHTTDEDMRPVIKYRAVVAYSVGSDSYRVKDGPTEQQPGIGHDVVVRYLPSNPGRAVVWPGVTLLWLAPPLFIFIFLANKICRGLFG